MPSMNKLVTVKCVQILSLFCEGLSMNWIARVADVSPNTVAKLGGSL
jgi:DNA-binding CsgD family transcriptional regulator